MISKSNLTACITSMVLTVSSFTLCVHAEIHNTSDAVHYVYTLVLKLIIPIVIVAVALIAFTMFSGNEQAMDKVPSRIKYVAASLCGIILLGLLISWGADLGKNNGSNTIAWDPNGNNTIVSDAVPGTDVEHIAENIVDGSAASGAGGDEETADDES